MTLLAGHTLGGSVGLAMVEDDVKINKTYMDEGEWEVDVAGVRCVPALPCVACNTNACIVLPFEGTIWT